MTYERIKACADMTLANVIEDLVEFEHITKEARDWVLESKTYQCLYDFESGMWMEGADYVRDTLHRCG